MRPSRANLNRAYYLSTRRSFMELENYLGKFYSNRAQDFDAEKLDRYLSVLEMDDKVLQQILFEKEDFPPDSDREMLGELRDFRPFIGGRK